MTDRYVPAAFANRWWIEGTLVTDSPLHIGSGARVSRSGVSDDGSVEVSGVFRGHDGLPWLPGSSLKGVLRARLSEAFGRDHPTVLTLFGKPEGEFRRNEREAGHGGRAEFLDAPATTTALPVGTAPPPFWGMWDAKPDSGRLTGLKVGVAIDRRTRTAANQKLFHREYVPPGISFAVRIAIRDVDEEHLRRLLWALEQFDPKAARPLALGAVTGNGWGRMEWAQCSVRCLKPVDVVAWLAKGGTAVADDLIQSLPPVTVVSEKPGGVSSAEAKPGWLRLKIRLDFDGPLLVRRPAPPKPKGDLTTPNAEPWLTPDGRVLVPASSMRGALRSQAERILRTLAPDDDTAARWAPDPSAKDPERLVDGDPTRLSLIAQIFGATGWRAPLEVSDFEGVQVKAPVTHELVAIDRFTGGAAGGAKFRFQFVWQPSVAGTLVLDWKRLNGAVAADWAPGLLALVLRDLMEGDISLGMGAGKGYGRISRGEVVEIALDGDPLALPPWLERLPLDLPEAGHGVPWPPPDELGLLLLEADERLRRRLDDCNGNR